MKQILPGVGLMALVALLAYWLSYHVLPTFAPSVLGVVLGMILSAVWLNPLPSTLSAGLRFTTTWILRTAIVFYGFKISLSAVLALGWMPLMIDLVVIASVLTLAWGLGKVLGLDAETRTLVGLGSAICGAAAVMGGEATLGNKPERSAVAVSTVVLFGTIAMFVYPLMQHLGLLSHLSPEALGVYVGSSVHEVAQVVATGNAMGDATTAAIAVTTKMLRVVMLAPVLLLIGSLMPSRQSSHGARRVNIPWFAILFLLMIGMHALLADWSERQGWSECYRSLVGMISEADGFALTMAMVALGVGTTWQKVRAAGYKPFLLALLLFVWLVSAGYLLSRYLI